MYTSLVQSCTIKTAMEYISSNLFFYQYVFTALYKISARRKTAMLPAKTSVTHDNAEMLVKKWVIADILHFCLNFTSMYILKKNKDKKWKNKAQTKLLLPSASQEKA